MLRTFQKAGILRTSISIRYTGFLIRWMNAKLFLKAGRIPHFKKNYVKNNADEKMDVYQGCAQFGVTGGLAAYIVQFHDENKGFNRYFRTMYAPDEAYFHTIVYKSPFVQSTLFTQKEDWPKLRDSGFLFFRKASSESGELLDYIDAQHLLQEKEDGKAE